MHDRKYLLATISTPCWKDLEYFNEETQKSIAKQFLIEEVSFFMNQQDIETETNQIQNISSDNDDSFLPKKRRKLETSPARLVNDYLESDCYELSLLKTMPIMEKIFRKFNTTLPSSAPVERLFSSAGGIFSKRRQLLKDESFRSQLLLKVNQKFWKNK